MRHFLYALLGLLVVVAAVVLLSDAGARRTAAQDSPYVLVNIADSAQMCPGDSDCDGMPDLYEGAHGCLLPSTDDAADDPDGDGWSNLAEFRLGTDPCVACAVTEDPNDEFPDPYPLDVNDDGFTDGIEIGAVAAHFDVASTPSNVRFNLSLDGFIDGTDIGIMAARFGEACVA